MKISIPPRYDVYRFDNGLLSHRCTSGALALLTSFSEEQFESKIHEIVGTGFSGWVVVDHIEQSTKAISSESWDVTAKALIESGIASPIENDSESIEP